MKSLVSMAFALALVLGCATARAQEGQEDDPEVLKMAKEHYKLGLEAYKAGKYDVAIKALKRAYLLKRLPPLLLNIAATYRKLGDNQMALHFYKKYLDEAPPDAKDRDDVQRTIVEIQDGGKPSEKPDPGEAPAPSSPKDEPAQPKNDPHKVAWNHNVIDAVPPDSPVDVRVSMPVLKGVKVYVYYRVPGEAEFKPVLMKRKGGEKVGRIPADAVAGTSLQYYIEARDPGGNVVKTIGSEASPNIIMVDPSAPPQTLAGFQDRGGEEPQPRAEEPEQRQADRGDEEEAPRPRKRRNLDDEAAPVAGPTSRSKGSQSSGNKTFLYAGAALTGVGVAGLAVGIAGMVLAKQYSGVLTDESRNPTYVDDNGMTQKIFFDSQAASYQSNGKLWNAIGIAGTAVGAAATITGVALIVVHTTRGSGGGEKPRKQRRPTPVEDSWYLTPAGSPTYAGVQAGFSF